MQTSPILETTSSVLPKDDRGFVTNDSLDGINKHRGKGRKLMVNSPYPGCELLAWFAAAWGVAMLLARFV